MIYSNRSLSCPELNLIKDKTPVLGLDIVERRSSLFYYLFGTERRQLASSFGVLHARTETYTGISYPVWKIRMYRHNTTFHNPKYRSETALADYIWDLQCPDRCYERGDEECEHSIDYELTWKILARAPGYNPITGMCRLCLKESFFILFHPETASLNKKTEIYQGCKHKQFKFLADCKVT